MLLDLKILVVFKKAIYPMINNYYKGRRRDIIAQAQSGTGKTGAFTCFFTI